MKKEARTDLTREMAQKRFDFLMEKPGTKAWMFEQSDGFWTVAWITADPGDALADTVSALGLDPAGAGTVAAGAMASDALGQLSARFESNGRPDAIGFDSKGGFSFGAYQIATRTGTMAAFLAHLATDFPTLHAALLAAGGDAAAKDGKDAFKLAWVKLARDASFGQAQHDFIRDTHYQPFVRKLKDDLGLDAEGRSAALRDVLWSVAVQHGAANRIVQTALAGRAASSLDDQALIQAIYAERSKVDIYFAGSTAQVRAAVAQRFAAERAQALTMLA